jgi:hypothetical protein
MNVLLAELDRLYVAGEDEQESQLVDAIKSLARRCRDSPHLYLKFYGD